MIYLRLEEKTYEVPREDMPLLQKIVDRDKWEILCINITAPDKSGFLSWDEKIPENNGSIYKLIERKQPKEVVLKLKEGK